jgi:hypothetical protein
MTSLLRRGKVIQKGGSMKVVKILAIIVLVYVGIVAAFEIWLGYAQPENQSTLIITTTDAEGEQHKRVVARLETDNHIYIAVNHWPRAWYYRVLDRPGLQVTYNEATSNFVAMPVTGAEFDQVNSEHALPLFFRVLTGFPPRRILRLDPA